MPGLLGTVATAANQGARGQPVTAYDAPDAFSFNEPQPPVYAADGRMSQAYMDWKRKKDMHENLRRQAQQSAPARAAGQAAQTQGQQAQQQFTEIYEAAQKPEDPAFREQQLALAAELRRRASGEAPSIVEMLLNRQRDSAIAAQRAGAASARPDMAGAAGLAASHNIGRIGMDTASQTVVGRLQEQQQAQNMLGALLGQGRGQDQAATQAQLQAMLAATGGTSALYGTNLQNQQAMAQLAQNMQLARMGQPQWWERPVGAVAGLLPMLLGL